jgi:hypothetical protein
LEVNSKKILKETIKRLSQINWCKSKIIICKIFPSKNAAKTICKSVGKNNRVSGHKQLVISFLCGFAWCVTIRDRWVSVFGIGFGLLYLSVSVFDFLVSGFGFRFRFRFNLNFCSESAKILVFRFRFRFKFWFRSIPTSYFLIVYFT